MGSKNLKFGYIGIALGSIALLLALVSFWAGPISPQPTLETLVAEKAASIRSAALDALSGKEVVSETYKTQWTIDKVIDVIIPLLGGLAVILAVVSFTQKEPSRITGGAAALGLSAIAFQFIAMYVMAILFVFLVISVIGTLGSG
ncbi:hypothetical protein F5I99_09000 [Nitrincola iocasae]|uniref:Uncharacterized protein n=1 Tax=Nitrincola iocasae TaxID=2614693 RepID=A0A5J6LE22_9GAMM|nr:hypothetical protein F5I99_09000 [Nitrincola iocasae]